MSRGLGTLQINILRTVADLDPDDDGLTAGKVAAKVFTLETGTEPTWENVEHWRSVNDCHYASSGDITTWANTRGIYRALKALAERGLLSVNPVYVVAHYKLTTAGAARIAIAGSRPDAYGVNRQRCSPSDAYAARRRGMVWPDAYKPFALSVKPDACLTFIVKGEA